MDLDQIKDYIRNHSEKDIYYEYLLGQEVWYFRENVKNEDPLLFYDRFKKFIAQKLEIHFHNISIIGSAKTRYSFSPDKKFRAFNQESDFDIVLVSNDLFNHFWSTFYDISKEQRVKNYGIITSSVFRKFISIKETDDNYSNEALKDWQRKLAEFRTQLQLNFKIHADINYRIYANWESVESYHLQGIQKLKNILNEAN